MSRLGMLILIGGLVTLLVACAPQASNSSFDSSSNPASTGFFNKEKNAVYISGGDDRIPKAVAEEEQKDIPQSSTTTKPPRLREQIKEFQISRYNEGAERPSRFGTKSFRLKIFFVDQKPIEFSGALGGAKPNFTINSTNDGFALSGKIDDSDEQSKGEFTLAHSDDSAKILYWAYKADLNIREDKTQTKLRGIEIKAQVESLKQNALGWVHNWSVVKGRSFYLVDIISINAPAPNAPALAFKGESLQTGDNSYDVNVVYGPAESIELVGNSEEEANRVFEVTLQDSKTKEKTEVMIDVKKSDDDDRDKSASGNGEEPQIQYSVDAFLQDDLTAKRTKKMVRDFERNRNLKGVKKMIAHYQGRGRSQLENFYRYANPFRRIIEAVANAYDVSSAFAYLTVLESKYFYGGKYEVQKASGSSALGPFQLIDGTARNNGLQIGGGKSDERRFFVPSSCGAANYIGKMVDIFDDGDSTLAILAYNQGEGGAAAAIYCAYNQDVSNREACTKKINRSFGGKDYQRFMKLAKKYNYTYAEMERTSAGLTKAMREYVNKKLAVYFISTSMQDYGFSIPQNARASLPKNGTVMPASGIIKDQKCLSIASSVL